MLLDFFPANKTGDRNTDFAAPVARAVACCDPPPLDRRYVGDKRPSLEENQAAHLNPRVRAQPGGVRCWAADGLEACREITVIPSDSTWSRGHSGSASAVTAALSFSVRSHGVAIEKVTDWGRVHPAVMAVQREASAQAAAAVWTLAPAALEDQSRPTVRVLRIEDRCAEDGGAGCSALPGARRAGRPHAAHRFGGAESCA